MLDMRIRIAVNYTQIHKIRKYMEEMNVRTLNLGLALALLGLADLSAPV